MYSKEKKNLFAKFETLTESNENTLIGGFSASISIVETGVGEFNSNNCNGGNCVSGCGNGQNVGTCNTTMGCGKT